MKDSRSLVWDYIVFVTFVVASTFISVYSKFFGPKENTKADFVFAVGRVSVGAMMLSIARGILGVRSFLGFPSELFYRGSAMWETVYGMVLSYPLVSYVFIPVYFSLGITSVYQYLDLRFKSRLVRCLASGTFVIRTLLNQGVTVYTPSVALYTVIGLPYWASIVGISLLSVIFSVLGGLKAAILADVMQMVTMIAVCVAIIIQGCIENGGIDKVFQRNVNGGRLEFMNFNMDPSLRVNTVSALVGQLFMSASIFGCQQNFVQRYCCMGSLKRVRKTMWWNMPVIAVLFSLAWIVGMIIYATYAECDPLTDGYIKKFDEIVPFYIEDRFTYFPGLLGLFVASLFNGSFTLNVSVINSLATVTFEDFIRPIPCLKGMTDKHQLYSIKAICAIYGSVIMGVSFLIGMLSGVIESSQLITAATSGPLLGVFIMAILIPCCNWKGAVTGMLTGHCIILWITFGGLTIHKPTYTLPLSTDGCSNGSFNWHIESDKSVWPDNRTTNNNTDVLTQIYSTSFMWYALIGTSITVGVGWIISCFTASDNDVYDENLIHPLARKTAKLFPGKKRHYLKNHTTTETENGGRSDNIIAD